MGVGLLPRARVAVDRITDEGRSGSVGGEVGVSGWWRWTGQGPERGGQRKKIWAGFDGESRGRLAIPPFAIRPRRMGSGLRGGAAGERRTRRRLRSG